MSRNSVCGQDQFFFLRTDFCRYIGLSRRAGQQVFCQGGAIAERYPDVIQHLIQGFSAAKVDYLPKRRTDEPSFRSPLFSEAKGKGVIGNQRSVRHRMRGGIGFDIFHAGFFRRADKCLCTRPERQGKRAYGFHAIQRRHDSALIVLASAGKERALSATGNESGRLRPSFPRRHNVRMPEKADLFLSGTETGQRKASFFVLSDGEPFLLVKRSGQTHGAPHLMPERLSGSSLPAHRRNLTQRRKTGKDFFPVRGEIFFYLIGNLLEIHRILLFIRMSAGGFFPHLTEFPLFRISCRGKVRPLFVRCRRLFRNAEVPEAVREKRALRLFWVAM